MEDLIFSMMGLNTNDESSPAPAVSREDFISNLKEGKYKKITVLTGAGISVSAGIPDFRSPETGLYTTLKGKYDLESPEDLFQLDTFIQNPAPFYDFAKEFDIDLYKPTKTHYFISFLNSKGILELNLTQNIDGLEFKAGVPEEKVVGAHGNLLKAHCAQCREEYPAEDLRESIRKGEILYCTKCEEEKIPVKPSVVFFGESLPVDFYKKRKALEESDCGIILGTSLMVMPFNFIPELYPKSADVVVINKEPLDHIKRLKSSLYLEGDSDQIVEGLIEDLGWTEEFQKFISDQSSG